MNLHDHEILTLRMKFAAVCMGMCRVPCAIMCYPFQGDHHAEFLQHQQPVGHDARLHQFARISSINCLNCAGRQRFLPRIRRKDSGLASAIGTHVWDLTSDQILHRLSSSML